MAGEVSFFEIGVEDADKGRAFYEAMFDWRMEQGPSGSGSVITTPNLPGGMHGGDAGANPYLFFRVDDMDVALDRVRELGGSVEDMDVDGDGDEGSQSRYGRFKFCRDDQGSAFGLHQPPAAA